MVDAEDTPRVSLIFCGGGCNIIVGGASKVSACGGSLGVVQAEPAKFYRSTALHAVIPSARVTYACPLHRSPDAGPAPHTEGTVYKRDLYIAPSWRLSIVGRRPSPCCPERSAFVRRHVTQLVGESPTADRRLKDSRPRNRRSRWCQVPRWRQAPKWHQAQRWR